MKYTTTMGVDIELKPIPLKNREAFLKCKAVLDSARAFDLAEEGSEDWHDARFKLHDNFMALCESMSIPADAVGEGDMADILSAIQTGELPVKKTEATETGKANDS